MAKSDSTKKPLSAIRIKALKPEQTIVDTGANAGLRIICGKKGVKTFFYRYRSPVDAKLKQIALGFFVDPINEDLEPTLGKKLLTLNSARHILLNLKLQRKSGICPATQLKEDIKPKHYAQQLTVQQMVEVYLTQHIEDHAGIDQDGNPTKDIIKGVRTKLKGQKETRRTLEMVSLKEFGQQLAINVTHVDIKHLINSILITGANVQAGRVLSELNLAFNYVIGRPEPVQGVNYKHWLEYLPEEHINPCIQAKMFFSSQKTKLSSSKATRVLDDNEIIKLLKWLPTSKFSPNLKHTLWITLHTGVRTGEAIEAVKSAFDLNKGTWLVKGKGADRYVQLSHQVINYLRPLIDNPINVTDYILPSGKTHKPLQQKVLSEQAWQLKTKGLMPDMPHWTGHDLRRTCRTSLSRLGCPNEVAEAVLGHARKGIEGTYDLYAYEKECAVWLQKWADHIDVIMGVHSNVTSINKEVVS